MTTPMLSVPEAEEIACIEDKHEASIDYLHQRHDFLTRSETTVLERLEEIKKEIELLKMNVRREREERRETHEVDRRLRSLESRILINEMDAESYLYKFALIGIGLIVSFGVVDAIFNRL